MLNCLWEVDVSLTMYVTLQVCFSITEVAQHCGRVKTVCYQDFFQYKAHKVRIGAETKRNPHLECVLYDCL